MHIKSLRDSLHTYYDNTFGFLVQLYARGGAVIHTSDTEIVLIETTIQPDGDVIMSIRPSIKNVSMECAKRKWETHLRKVESRVDLLRRLRKGLKWLPYASIVPFLSGVYESYEVSLHWNWIVVTFSIGVLLLAGRWLAALIFQLIIRRALNHFSLEEWQLLAADMRTKYRRP